MSTLIQHIATAPHSRHNAMDRTQTGRIEKRTSHKVHDPRHTPVQSILPPFSVRWGVLQRKLNENAGMSPDDANQDEVMQDVADQQDPSMPATTYTSPSYPSTTTHTSTSTQTPTTPTGMSTSMPSPATPTTPRRKRDSGLRLSRSQPATPRYSPSPQTTTPAPVRARRSWPLDRVEEAVRQRPPMREKTPEQQMRSTRASAMHYLEAYLYRYTHYQFTRRRIFRLLESPLDECAERVVREVLGELEREEGRRKAIKQEAV